MMLNGWSPGGCVTMDFGGLYWLFNLVRSLGPCFHVVLFTRHGSGGDKLADFNSFLMVMDAVKFRDCLGWPGLHSSTSLLCKFGNVTPWPLEETDDLIKLSPGGLFLLFRHLRCDKRSVCSHFLFGKRNQQQVSG